MTDSLLKKAGKLYRRRLYSQVTELLEPQILLYRDQEEFYRLLGLSCLYKKDWSGVETYLQRYRQMTSSTNETVLLGLGLAAIKKKDYQEGIRLFLKVLDLTPGSSRARRGLKLLRQTLASESEPGIDLQSPRWKKVFPSPSRRFPFFVLWIFPLLVLLGLGVWIGGVLFGSLAVSLPGDPGAHRPGPGTEPALTPGTGSLVQSGGVFSLSMKDDEVRATYAQAQKYFQAYRDSLARREINRILLSNASQAMKEKARALIPYLKDPEFVSFQDSQPFSEVKALPELYEGCAVKWRGVVSNLQNGKNEITFDFLLGYENAQVVDAVLPVKLYFPVLLKNSQIIELLAVVEKGSPFGLRGVSLRDLGFRKP